MQLQRLLDDLVEPRRPWADAPDAARSSSSPADVRALLADRLRGRPTRANFRTGHLTICTLVPMRSVPHRVVCLLGLDDGVFPRHVERDGDDLIVADPQVGDNDARTEDRQLLLDALLAATDRLVITYTARDERTNLVRPPAVPLGELLDVIDRTGESRRRASPATSVTDPPSAAAVRRAQLHPGAPVARAALELRRRQPRRCPGLDSSAGAARTVAPWPRCRSSTSKPSSSSASRPSWAPGPGLSCASRLGVSLGRPVPRSSTTPSRSSSTRLERWGVAERLLGGPPGRAPTSTTA